MKTPEQLVEDEALKVTTNKNKILTLGFAEKCVKQAYAKIATELYISLGRALMNKDDKARFLSLAESISLLAEKLDSSASGKAEESSTVSMHKDSVVLGTSAPVTPRLVVTDVQPVDSYDDFADISTTTDDDVPDISRCKNGCGCMTHTRPDGTCGKCGTKKVV